MAEKKYVSDNPVLMAEWNWEKNKGLGFVSDILTLGSNKKVWWRCQKGHEWRAPINRRNRGSCCPYCSGRFTIIGENDLVTINPELALEWNYERNGNLKPEECMVNSGKKVW